jgi:DNA modification methylase
MRPYYEHGGITIYHGDARTVLPALAVPDLVLTDPPYGIAAKVDNARFVGGGKMIGRDRVTKRRPVEGDDQPFDPRPLLHYKRLILFGANNYAAHLPASNGWLVWDKRAGIEGVEGWPLGEGELAWTNVTGGIRFFRNRWFGLVRSDEVGEHYHPTQKPVALMAWAIGKWSKRNDLILDPYMGCGTTLVAAKMLGRRAVGIEIEERYCEIAVRRLSQEVLDLGATA